MQTSAVGSRAICQRVLSAGFTLLELLVVIAIMAIATAGVSLAMRDASEVQLEREAQRLAALLESARARSRASGVPVHWYASADGFRFQGLANSDLPQNWLDSATMVVGAVDLQLGPEPVIGPQAVVLSSQSHPERRLRLATDGVRPFVVQSAAP